MNTNRQKFDLIPDSLLFLSLFLYYYQIKIIGAIGVGEIIILCWALVLLVRKRFTNVISNKTIWAYLFFAVLWLIGIIHADINLVNPKETIKAFGSIVLITFFVVFLTDRLLTNFKRTIFIFFIAIGLSTYFSFQFSTQLVYQGFLTLLSPEQLYERYFVYSIHILGFGIIGYTWYANKRYLAYFISIIFVFLAYYLTSRNLTLVFIASSSLFSYLLFKKYVEKYDLKKITSESLCFLISFIHAFVFLAIILNIQSTLISYTSNSLLKEGTNTSESFMIKMLNDSYLLEKTNIEHEKRVPFWYTRRQFLQGVYILFDSPLGLGTKYDPTKYNYIERANNFFGLPFENEIIPYHSHIIGAAVFYGVLSLPYWLFMLYINTRIIFMSLSIGHSLHRYVGFLLPLSFHQIWQIFFSPLSNRILIALPLAIYVFAQINSQKMHNQ